MDREWITVKPKCDLIEFNDLGRLCFLGAEQDDSILQHFKLDKPTEVSCNLLLDLHKQGWEIKVENNEVIVARPNDEDDIMDQKERVRDQENVQREESLKNPKVREFLNYMETYNVQRLVRDGEEFRKSLEEFNDGKKDIKEVIDPYIQYVDDGVDEHTGFKLKDIRTYFRWTLCLDNRNKPGRKFMFLIRDRAVENHPVIGLMEFGAGPTSMSDRDNFLGWTPRSHL